MVWEVTYKVLCHQAAVRRYSRVESDPCGLSGLSSHLGLQRNTQNKVSQQTQPLKVHHPPPPNGFSPGLHTWSWSLLVALQVWSWLAPQACSGHEELWPPPESPLAFQAWLRTRSLPSAQPCSGPRARPAVHAWFAMLRSLHLPGTHACSCLVRLTWSLPQLQTCPSGWSQPGTQAPWTLSLLVFQLRSWWDRSMLASGPWCHKSFGPSLWGSFAVGGVIEPESLPLASPPDDITEELPVG